MQYATCPRCGTTTPQTSLDLHAGICRDCHRAAHPSEMASQERLARGIYLAMDAVVFVFCALLPGLVGFALTGELDLAWRLRLAAGVALICGVAGALAWRVLLRVVFNLAV